MAADLPDISTLTDDPAFAGLSKRQCQIVERVRDQGFVTIEALAEEFDTSAQTVRRDIIRLSEIGLLQRFHGGAGLAETTTRPPRVVRADDTVDDKRRVAAALARMIGPNTSVFLDAGSTTRMVAEALRAHQGVRIVTSNLFAALALAEAPRVSVQLVGGEMRGEDCAIIGAQAAAMLMDVRVDVAVIACDGFDMDGTPMSFDSEKIAIKRAAMRGAAAAILAVDASKFLRPAMMRIAPSTAFTTIVTSAPPPNPLAAAFDAANLAVVTA